MQYEKDTVGKKAILHVQRLFFAAFSCKYTFWRADVPDGRIGKGARTNAPRSYAAAQPNICETPAKSFLYAFLLDWLLCRSFFCDILIHVYCRDALNIIHLSGLSQLPVV